MGICYLYKRGSGSGGSGGSIVEIIKTASGRTITLSDSAQRALRGLKVFGKTTQNGTPTPDTPVLLESVGDGGSLGVTVAGKNLFDNTGIDFTSSTLKLSFVTDGDYVKINGTKSAGANVVAIKRPNIILPAGTYTEFLQMVSGTITTADNFDGFYFGINESTYGQRTTPAVAKVGDVGKRTFTLESDTLLTSFDITPGYSGVGTVFNDVKLACMLVRGDTANEFIPGEPIQTLTIQKITDVPVFLPGIPVTSGGNYTDENGQQWVCDEVNFADGKYVQRVEKKQYTGTESLSYNSRANNVAAVLTKTEQTNKVDTQILCTHFRAGTINDVIYSGNAIACRTGGDGLVFGLKTNIDLTPYTQSEVVTIVRDLFVSEYESGNPVTVVYALAEPIEHNLTAEELAQYAALHTNYPNTTIFNDGGANMEVKYVTIGG